MNKAEIGMCYGDMLLCLKNFSSVLTAQAKKRNKGLKVVIVNNKIKVLIVFQMQLVILTCMSLSLEADI